MFNVCIHIFQVDTSESSDTISQSTSAIYETEITTRDITLILLYSTPHLYSHNSIIGHINVIHNDQLIGAHRFERTQTLKKFRIRNQLFSLSIPTAHSCKFTNEPHISLDAIRVGTVGDEDLV